MRNIARVMFLALAVSGVPSALWAAEAAPKLADGPAAIKAAEVAAAKLLTGNLMAAARPFVASQHGDIWLVISKPALPPKQAGGAKLSVVVQLDRNTGEVLDVDTAQ